MKDIIKFDEKSGVLTFSCKGTEHTILFDRIEADQILEGKKIVDVGNGPGDYLYVYLETHELILIPYTHVIYYLRRDEKKS